MTEHVWSDAFEKAVAAFDGQTPKDAEQEQTVIDAFVRSPERVYRLIDEVADGMKAGTVNWGWAILARRCSGFAAADVRVSGEGEKQRAIQRAETWMRNAGMHFDREAEVVDELFNPVLGRLRGYHDDEELRKRMVALWREVRPIGKQLDKEMVERLRPKNQPREDEVSAAAANVLKAAEGSLREF